MTKDQVERCVWNEKNRSAWSPSCINRITNFKPVKLGWNWCPYCGKPIRIGVVQEASND